MINTLLQQNTSVLSLTPLCNHLCYMEALGLSITRYISQVGLLIACSMFDCKDKLLVYCACSEDRKFWRFIEQSFFDKS